MLVNSKGQFRQNKTAVNIWREGREGNRHAGLYLQNIIGWWRIIIIMKDIKKDSQLAALLTVSTVSPVSVVRHALRVGLGRQPQVAAQTGSLVMTAQRLGVLHEASPVIVVLASPVSHLLLLHGVLPAPVPLDEADDDTDGRQEDEGEHHADEPAGAGHRGLVDLVHGREVGVRHHVLDPAGGLELPVHRHHSELVGQAGLQAAHHDGVLVQLVLGLDPLGLLLLPVNRERV